MDEFEARLREGLSQVPPTNEVARSCSLLGGFLALAERFGHPLRLCELGASAGLNQQFDRHHYELGDFHWGPADASLRLQCDWRGRAPALSAPLEVTARSGCDRAPIDLSSEQDRIKLMAYFWADQVERIDRLRRAIEVARSHPVAIARADASEWLAAELEAGRREGVTTVGRKEPIDLVWDKNDSFTLPPWRWHRYRNRSKTEPAILFSVTDKPMLEMTGLHREERG